MLLYSHVVLIVQTSISRSSNIFIIDSGKMSLNPFKQKRKICMMKEEEKWTKGGEEERGVQRKWRKEKRWKVVWLTVCLVCDCLLVFVSLSPVCLSVWFAVFVRKLKKSHQKTIATLCVILRNLREAINTSIWSIVIRPTAPRKYSCANRCIKRYVHVYIDLFCVPKMGWLKLFGNDPLVSAPYC